MRTLQIIPVITSREMVQLTPEQRVFVVLNYTRTQSTTQVRNAFRERFPNRNPPAASTILENVRKYENSGTSLNLNKSNSGRRRTTRTAENIDAVRDLLQENPHMSARRNPIPISRASFNRITRQDIKWHPYRMHVRHELLPADFARRLRFSVWLNERCRRENFLDSFLIGDEASFVMNGEVNTQNVRQYAPKGHPPAFNFERSHSREHLTVWAALCGNGMIFGLYFFEQNVNGIAYLRMFNEFVFPQLAERFNNQHWEGMFRGLWWAQDGAPAHRLIAVRDRLNAVFGNNRVIGLGHNVEWPPRSPDLTPCDFFLWGYIKDKVFSSPPRDIDELRQKIIREFNALREQPAFVTRAVRDMHRRTMLCVAREGGHVEGHGA